MNAFKNLLGVAFSSDYSFPAAEAVKNAASAAPVAATSAPAAGGDAAPVAEEKEEEEEADMDMGGLFGDDY